MQKYIVGRGERENIGKIVVNKYSLKYTYSEIYIFSKTYIFSEKENMERLAVNIYSLALAISIIPSPGTNTQTVGNI